MADRIQAQQQQQRDRQRSRNTAFLRWRRGLSDEERTFVDTLSTDELYHLIELEDDNERTAILNELRNVVAQSDQSNASVEFATWYLDLSESDREIVDGLSEEDFQNIADLPIDLRNKMIRWHARKEAILREKERRERRAANRQSKRRTRRAKNFFSSAGQRFQKAASSPIHGEVRQWMREKAVDVRRLGRESIARRDAVRRMMPDYMWALIATLLVILGSIWVGYTQK